VLYAVARSSADITGLVCKSAMTQDTIQEPGQICDASSPVRDLSLVPGEQINLIRLLAVGHGYSGISLVARWEAR